MLLKQQRRIVLRSTSIVVLLLLCCLSLTWTTVLLVDGAASVRECGADEECTETIDMSCTEFLRDYSLSGSCCSLADISTAATPDGATTGGGCILTVAGAEGDDEGEGNDASCTYNERECPYCCSSYYDDETGEEEMYCVAPNQSTIYSRNTQYCPASSYDPFPSAFVLNPWSVTVVVENNDNNNNEDDNNNNIDCDDEDLHASYRTILEDYLDEKLGADYPGILIKLGKPTRRRRLGSIVGGIRNNMRVLGGGRRKKGRCTLDFTGTAIISKNENPGIKIGNKGIVSAQVTALDEFSSVRKNVKKVDGNS